MFGGKRPLTSAGMYTSIGQVNTARQPRYHAIADDLRRGIERRDYGTGQLLPSESALSTSYGVSRVTVRRALDVLRREGLVGSRQGLGWTVKVDPLRQRLAQLGTIERQLESDGRSWERRVLAFAFVDPPTDVSMVLGPGQVLRVVRLNLADGEPFARVTVWCPEGIAHNLSRADVERAPFYELLDVDLAGGAQVIAAGIEITTLLTGTDPRDPTGEAAP